MRCYFMRNGHIASVEELHGLSALAPSVVSPPPQIFHRGRCRRVNDAAGRQGWALMAR
jgi:hypothetical protein